MVHSLAQILLWLLPFAVGVLLTVWSGIWLIGQEERHRRCGVVWADLRPVGIRILFRRLAGVPVPMPARVRGTPPDGRRLR